MKIVNQYYDTLQTALTEQRIDDAIRVIDISELEKADVGGDPQNVWFHYLAARAYSINGNLVNAILSSSAFVKWANDQGLMKELNRLHGIRVPSTDQIESTKIILEETILLMRNKLITLDENKDVQGNIDKVKIEEKLHWMENYWVEQSKRQDVITGKKACFIATATFESPCAPQVIALREFRDGILNKSLLGRLFVYFYYCLSPRIAGVVSSSSILKKILRIILSRLISILPKR